VQRVYFSSNHDFGQQYVQLAILCSQSSTFW